MALRDAHGRFVRAEGVREKAPLAFDPAQVNLSILRALPEYAAVCGPGESVMGGMYEARDDEYVLQFWPMIVNMPKLYAERYGYPAYTLIGPVPYVIRSDGVPDKPYTAMRHNHFSNIVFAPWSMGQSYPTIHPVKGSGSGVCRGAGGVFMPDPVVSGILLRTWHLQVHNQGGGNGYNALDFWRRSAGAFFDAYPFAQVIVCATEGVPQGKEGVYPLSRSLVDAYVESAGKPKKNWWGE